jgi:hypothetical protein
MGFYGQQSAKSLISEKAVGRVGGMPVDKIGVVFAVHYEK